MNQTLEVIQSEKLDRSQEILRALSHKLRLQILNFIDKRKSCNVKEIYKELNLEQSVTSQQLKILRDANLVLSERQGKIMIYYVNYSELEKVEDSLTKFHD